MRPGLEGKRRSSVLSPPSVLDPLINPQSLILSPRSSVLSNRSSMCSPQFSILNLHFFSPLETLHFCCRYAKNSLFVPKFKIHFYLLVNVFNTRALGIKFWIKSALEFKLQVLPQCQLNANGFGKCCMFKCLSRHIGLAPIFNKSLLRKILPRHNNEKQKLYIYHT